jgi:hypothetical protein
MNGIDTWGDPQTSWHEQWATLLGRLMQRPEVKVTVDNAYTKWLHTVKKLYEGKIPFAYISEISNRVNGSILKHSVHSADALMHENKYLLLVNKQLSKFDILSKECVFRNVIWLVNFIEQGATLKEKHKSGQLKCPRFRTVEEYKKHLLNSIIRNKDEAMQLVISAYKYHESYRKQQIDAIEHETKELYNLLTELNEAPNLLDDYFNESDWDNCYQFPYDDYTDRLRYSLCPVFYDLGDGIYIRKETIEGVGYDKGPYYHRKGYYLKKVSYDEFIKWVTN